MERFRSDRSSPLAEAPRPSVVPEARKRPNYADNIAKSRGTYSHCPEHGCKVVRGRCPACDGPDWDSDPLG